MSPRTDRRATGKPKGRPTSVADLRARLDRARATGAGKDAEARARRMLAAYLDTAAAHGMSLPQAAGELARGQAAARLGDVSRDTLMQNPPRAVTEAACAEGCAFCCILQGGDGGTITEAEAIRLHDALAPLAGQPDGRGWHPAACPALDPETRACRAYDARPTICRSFISTDAEACRVNAEGGQEAGAGLLGSHLDYLAVHALARDLLKGLARVPTYAMARVAEGAVEGEDRTATLDAARHKPRALEDACRDAAKAGGR
ncbi:YkgJ family cysteine cluster protein [Psychromarinibacter sp. S121]|uniref:YkgJ family cysteine cluster protein n=1 Tax=Psychromarinibacter sp. S121 TaxID=3415127 RepID=UPI003C7EC6AF